MTVPDYVVLVSYFLVMAGIGLWSMRQVKAQEDYFMGGRTFGKFMQTFAAFGAGTGSSDPVNTARTTVTNGMSGMWSVMYWLFVTPFYWITAVWYRRMRHLTLGDWFVERYESRALGAAYTVFGLLFYMVYGSMLFSAIGKVAAPLMGFSTFTWGGEQIGIEYLLVPIIGLVVLVYGILGGLRAAYLTDVIQGCCIILLSVLLIPVGLAKLVEKFGNPETDGLLDGFRILHEQLPAEQFDIVGTSGASEFPIYFIAAVVLINLVGVVVQPHFIATGGGSARTEASARIGLVTGNFLKRFCTVGWALTALIALALFADRPELIEDPDKTWGIASRELLGPGWTGLMLSCLLAALMSSVDAYMIVGSGLVVRNIYAAYINPTATEKEYVLLGRMAGVLVVGGSVIISLFMMDVFKQLQLTWIVNVLFAAPFWVGILWRRATRAAAWLTVGYCALAFFLVPWLLPSVWPDVRSSPALTRASDVVVTVTRRNVSPSDVRRREAAIEIWDGAEEKPGPRPEPVALGEVIEEVMTTGGVSIFWSGGVQAIGEDGTVLQDPEPRTVGPPEVIDDHTTRTVRRHGENVRFRGEGSFKLDLLIYQWLGMDLTTKSNAFLRTLELPPKIFMPFLVMILASLATRRNRKESLDRYYAKMRTPVDADPVRDREALEQAYADPARTEGKKLFPGTDLEIQKPSVADVLGFVISVLICFAVIGLAAWVAGIGA